MAVPLLLGFVAATIIAFAAWRLHALDRGGALASALAGTLIFGFGGIGPSAALIVFFITGSVLSSLPTGSRQPRRRNKNEPLLRKEEIAGGYARNWRQVAANGGVPLATIVAAHFLPYHSAPFLHAFYGAIAAMCADSWGTEIGTRFGRSTHDVLTGTELPMGPSGGISFRGMVGSFGGAAAVALTAGWANPLNIIAVCAIVLAGSLGAISDSIIGSSLQAKFHYIGETIFFETLAVDKNGRQTILASGYKKVTNNTVNFAASIIGALIIVILLDAP